MGTAKSLSRKSGHMRFDRHKFRQKSTKVKVGWPKLVVHRFIDMVETHLSVRNITDSVQVYDLDGLSSSAPSIMQTSNQLTYQL